MALLLRTSGAIEFVHPTAGDAFTLPELQGFVGGYIEVVRGPWRDRWLVLNEEGKRLMMPVNYGATVLYHEAGGALDDVVVGDVLLATFTEIGGET
jgi:hypothetical protein